MRLEILWPTRAMHKILYVCRLGRQTKEAGSLKHKQLAEYKNVVERQGLACRAEGGIFVLSVR
jgi:benzoyl-CoA reductase/2-hydroxyglutaryl-CoA dehydratase subunit BcrC/BadD/HgdB